MRTQEQLARSTLSPGAGADFIAEPHAGLVVLTPLSEHARTWLKSHVASEATWNHGSLIPEIQHFPAFADAVLDAGFLFERDA